MPADDPLLDAYRVIRRIDAPEAPWPGLLVQSVSGAAVLVDAAELGDDWPGWSAAPDGHVLAPIDLVRWSTGHAAAMPVCSERLDDFLLRRADAPLTDGELLTLAVSVLRGLAEVGREGSEGTWWLIDDGRPALALHPGGEPVSEAARELLLRLGGTATPRLAAALADAAGTVGEPARLPRALPRLEESLFAVAAPEPLATTVFAPRRARALAASEGRDTSENPRDEEPGLVARLARHMDADLADAFSRATTAVWRRFRSERSAGRRRPALVAGVAAIVVLGAGLLWPTGGPATAGGSGPDAGAAMAPPSSPASTAPSGDQSADTPKTDDDGEGASLASVLDGLLSARAECHEDPGCLVHLVEDPARAFPKGVVDEAPDARSITLLDEFGGAAVLRVDGVAGDAPAQLVVIVRRNDEWVLRDVHDVAEHPS